ncbi:hypothetical protein BOTNAR_0364g00130 [Botryotinia narcissicola]|uniref:Uncharacterized protein n=1 Tax=Botryotinia narcissicola TaxID=278944 RepID=A0A4Z1HVU0_9HELO|nr:hypothetical protein BOTNAR_0364g00130 [Botryotinia narcissicola]
MGPQRASHNLRISSEQIRRKLHLLLHILLQMKQRASITRARFSNRTRIRFYAGSDGQLTRLVRSGKRNGDLHVRTSGEFAAGGTPAEEVSEADNDGGETGDGELIAGFEEEEVESEFFLGVDDGVGECKGICGEKLNHEFEFRDGCFGELEFLELRCRFFESATIESEVEEWGSCTEETLW